MARLVAEVLQGINGTIFAYGQSLNVEIGFVCFAPFSAHVLSSASCSCLEFRLDSDVLLPTTGVRLQWH